MSTRAVLQAAGPEVCATGRSAAAPALADFQDAFARALLAPPPDGSEAPLELDDLVRQPAFAVYRNTVLKGCIDALQASYPSVHRLVGTEWFRAAAALHVRARPPTDVRMDRYGAGFAAFLGSFEPARDLPYLSGVAQLDRAWTEAHLAREDAALDGATLAAVPPHRLGALCLRPHAAARWAWFDELPIFTIWRRQREADDDAPLHWHGEGAVLTRPQDAVRWAPLSRAGCTFLDACAQGLPLAQVAQRALETDDHADLAALMALLLDQGALATDGAATWPTHTSEESR